MDSPKSMVSTPKKKIYELQQILQSLKKSQHTKAENKLIINESNETIKRLKHVLYNKSNEYDNKSIVKHAFNIYNKGNNNANDVKFHSDSITLMLKIFLNSHNPEKIFVIWDEIHKLSSQLDCLCYILLIKCFPNIKNIKSLIPLIHVFKF